MSQILSLFTPQLLFGVFWPSILQITSADHVSVHPGENITLHCNISITTNYAQILWYQLGSEEVKLLISAEQARLKKKFIPTYNVNESQFYITERCSLVIFGIRQTDLGFYYCEGRKDQTHIQFGKPIRLSFTEDHDTSSEPPDTEPCTGSEMWFTRTVCLISVLINLLCMCVICYRFKGRSASSSSSSSSYCCSNTKGSTEKVDKQEENVHYASIQHKRKHRAAAKKKTSLDLDSVTYATVTLQAGRH